MSQGLALPLVGMAAGSMLMIVGSSSLTATWLSRELPSSERWKHGLVAVGLVGLGTALNALASAQFARET